MNKTGVSSEQWEKQNARNKGKLFDWTIFTSCESRKVKGQ